MTIGLVLLGASSSLGAAAPRAAVPTPSKVGGPVVLLTPDPTNTIAIDKTNTADGEPASDGGTVQPGDVYTYNFTASCSSINVDCVNLTTVDTFPADVVVDESTIPPSIAGFRDVTWDGSTLTVVYTEALANPPGATGKIAGTSDSYTVTVTLPQDTPLEDGTVIPNGATVSADNVEESATDPSPVVVDIPRVVDVGASKSFSDPSAIAGDPDARTTIELGADNLSSSSAEVTEMTIEDSTTQTWEYLDLVSVTVSQYPAGAEQAQLFVCPSANAPCDSDDDYVAGGTGAPPGPSTLALPGAVPAGDVVGVRVVFTDTDGSFIAPVAGGGTAGVEIETDLRDDVRSTGQPITEIPETTIIDNVATATATDPQAEPSTVSDDAGAEYQILPPTLILEPTKTFYPDENGNFQTDTGEHAVIGERSGVSMGIDATNASAFPIGEIVITEPGVAPPETEFDKVDATSIRLRFPTGAANAHVVVTYDDGSATEDDYPAPGPGSIDLGEPPPRVTSVTVTYTGPDGDGDGNPDPTIEPGATAGVDVHGNLNDLVDESDVSGAGIDNCADFEGSGGGVPGTTGTFVGTACTQLPVEARDPGAGGEKTASQTTIPPDQPVVFTMSTANNGNLPLYDVVVADPPLDADGTPPLTPTFEFMRFLDAGILNDDVAADIALEVYVLGTGWMAYPGPSDAQLALIIGVRATIPVLAPTESFDLLVGMQLRYFADPATTIENCYGITADDSTGAQVVDVDHCAPPLTPETPEQAATLNKAITPSTVPVRLPGMDPADSAATVQLRVQNTGSLTARYLQVTDEDADFWDAVDLASLGTITPPATGVDARADLVQIDAFVDGEWVDGTAGPVASAGLPPGVTPEQVRGLRFTFSSTLTINDGYVITPCNEDPAGACAAVVEFVVEPRLALLSTGEPLPETLEDTATGEFSTQLAPEGTAIPPVTDDLTFVPGDPQLDVSKTPEATTVQPGQIGTFDLTTTNNGTANLPDLTVSDPIPEGLLFDDTYADPDTGDPYTITWTNLPDGYPEPPTAVFEVTPDPDDPARVGLVRWTFPGWDMPPNASVNIFFRYTLEPGVLAGQQITNTMGASSPVDDLACTDPDVVVTDGDFGDGTYCTDPAGVTVTAGASFSSRKWVAGNPALGWYNQSTGELVPVGGGGCLSLEALGREYTTNPCIALVNPGEEFHYVLRVENAGTEDGLRMVIVDTFPAPGDTGVLGAPRGTEWSTAPTLVGPAVYDGPATGEIGYTSGTACTDDLVLDGPPCPAGSWADPPGEDTTALRLDATFDPEPLPPGGVVDVYFTMQAPADVPRVSDPTVAYNSLAHAETTEIAPGTERVLPPLEPLKVGVATMYGTLEVIKEIGDNPAGLVLDGTEFTFEYSCVLTNGEPSVSGTVTATPTTPGLVEGIPAGATCEVWEIATNGGIPSATEDDPVEVVIETSLDPEDPVVSSVTVTNDFPLGEVSALKTVTGDAQPEFTGGPYAARLTCTFLDETLPGYPVVVELTQGEPVTADVPVGAECTVVEEDIPDAVTVTYEPANDDGTAGVVVVPSEEGAAVTLGVANAFATGSLVITKLVSGPGAPEFSTGPFVFGVSCDYLEQTDVFAVAVVVEGSEDGSPVESDPVTGLPIGAVCTVTEIDGGGADVLPDPVTVVIEADEQAEVVLVSFTNPFSAGTVAVAKTVDGDAAASDYVSGLEYTLAVQCDLDTDAGRITVLEAEVTVAGDGVPVPVTSADGTPTLVPAGARCWAVETSTGGATTVTIDHDSYETGAEVLIDSDAEAPQEILITASNTFDSGVLELTKLVVGDAEPGADYTFSVMCTIEDKDGTTLQVPVLDGDASATLAAGESVDLEVLVGATCEVTEIDVPGDATLSFATTGGVGDDDTADGVVTVGPDGASVVATNTFPDARGLPPTGTPNPAGLVIVGLVLVAAGLLTRRLVLRQR